MLSAEQAKEAVAEYTERWPDYVQFATSMADLLVALLKAKNIDYVGISSRAKDIDSFAEKIGRDGKDYADPMRDVTDLCGVRVVSYDESDVALIGDAIRENFVVSDRRSVDKARELDPDKFGYLSVHFVVSLTEQRASLPEYQPFQGMWFELQVRTALQHAWAALDHKLRYKATTDVPRELRRRLYRISALLELADAEFRRLGADASGIRSQYREDVESGSYDEVGIDADSVDAFLSSTDHVERLASHAEAAGIVCAPAPPNQKTPWSRLVRSLNAVGATSLGDLERQLASFYDDATEVFGAISQRWRRQMSERSPSHAKVPPFVVGPGTLVRLAVVMSNDGPESSNALKQVPFGNLLQQVVRDEVQARREARSGGG